MEWFRLNYSQLVYVVARVHTRLILAYFFFFFLKFFFLSTLCFSCYISIIVRFPPPSLPSQKITSHTCTRISAQSNTCCTSIIAICSHRCINRICDRREKNYNSTFNCWTVEERRFLKTWIDQNEFYIILFLYIYYKYAFYY